MNIINIINLTRISPELDTLLRLTCVSVTLICGWLLVEKVYKLARRFFRE